MAFRHILPVSILTFGLSAAAAHAVEVGWTFTTETTINFDVYSGSFTIDYDQDLGPGAVTVASIVNTDFGGFPVLVSWDETDLIAVDGESPTPLSGLEVNGITFEDDAFRKIQLVALSNLTAAGGSADIEVFFGTGAGASQVSGTIIGTVLNDVPLPAGAPLLAAGLLGLGWLGRRRR